MEPKSKLTRNPILHTTRIGWDTTSRGPGRDCLRLESRDIRKEYTHIHWAFLEIDEQTWKPIVKDPYKQWDGFKTRKAKLVGSFGGWALSTDPNNYTIIREAIINHAEDFATNVAAFVKDEGIDGVDFDWEYPGATDILVNGQPIGQEGDGEHYLRFLKLLKQRLGDHLLSIAAPASYWYLKAFPILEISEVVDYIVYMTYDLHGQWDYGNPNSFDECASGKCLRSHVNITETTLALAMITKAGVANTKIFIGNAQYGRSFHMANGSCWEPHCEFTGSSKKSEAKPGRCTKERGYISLAEIHELQESGKGNLKSWHDDESGSDIILHDGDYIAYLDTDTSVYRRMWANKWQFAGTADWAIDLTRFGPKEQSVKSGTKEATTKGAQSDAAKNPPKSSDQKEKSSNGADKTIPGAYDYDGARQENADNCSIFKEGSDEHSAIGLQQCENYCYSQLARQKDFEYKNYGCVGSWPADKDIPWYHGPGGELQASGHCECNNALVSEFAKTIIEALPRLAAVRTKEHVSLSFGR